MGNLEIPTSEARLTNRIQEEEISVFWDKIEEMDTSDTPPQKKLHLKNTPGIKYPGNLGHYIKTKSNSNRNREEKKSRSKAQKIFSTKLKKKMFLSLWRRHL